MCTYVRRLKALWAAVVLSLLCVACPLVGCSGPDIAVPVRDTVNDYSWQELETLSDAIAQAPDTEAGKQIAIRYHLSTNAGMLDGTQSKEIVLADGSKTAAVILGFRHDTASDGSAAGISFAFADAIALRGMNNDAGLGEFTSEDDTDAIGGWPASDARRWLNGEFAALLPVELAATIKEVEKPSATVPEFELGGVSDQGTVEYTPDQVTGTSVDALWLLSVAEISGVSPDSEAAAERPEWTAILQAEGTQYQLFADAGVNESEANAILARAGNAGGERACRWWLRSLENGTFSDVRDDGSIDRMEEATGGEALGIVPCFAI